MIDIHSLRSILLFSGISLSSWASAEPAVSILEMSSINTPMYDQTSQSVYVKILVPNHCFEKDVALIFHQENSPSQRIVARYLGPADADNEIWEAYSNLGPGNYWVQVDFTEASQPAPERMTWVLREGSGPVIYDERSLLSIYNPQVMSKQAAQFNVAIRNVAYNKRVRLHYSHDAWQTSQSMDLNYLRVFKYGRGSVVLPNDEGFEVWSGAPQLKQDIDELSYYFSYEVAGQTFIDNNFGHNYTVLLR